jgi:hypothetical protein
METERPKGHEPGGITEMKAVTWPVVLVAHAYAGAVTAATRDEKVKRSSAWPLWFWTRAKLRR